MPHSSAQTLWPRLLVEELVRQGVGLFVLAPGSRSTPLAAAVAENPRAEHLVHFDERGGGFAALGFARATGKPAAWITTSGTAVANGLPMVVEADADGVPIILLTADRPPELRDTGANQTIRQPDIFDSFTRWRVDLPVPDPEIDPAFVLTTAAQAAYRALSPPGPVHVNAMFREPLVPVQEVPFPASLERWREGGRPYTTYAVRRTSVGADDVADIAATFELVERGLVVLGKTDDPEAGRAAGALALSLGWPLLADVASGGHSAANAAAHYDLFLASDRLGSKMPPEVVLQLGGRVTSRPLLRFIVESDPAHYVVVAPDGQRHDPAHAVTNRVRSGLVDFCEALRAQLVPRAVASGWLNRWMEVSRVSEEVLQRSPVMGRLSEPWVARAIGRLMPENHGLVAASSLPIRHLDACAVLSKPGLRVTANRGASGIDGTVATSAGFSRGLSRSTTLLVGDLALLHDLNSLALLREGAPVTVVLLNNDGGGIFNLLSIAERREVFERFFATPHGLGFEHAAAQFGLSYRRPSNQAEFEEAYLEATASGRSSVLEVVTSREETAAQCTSLREEVVEAVERVSGA